MEKSLNIIRQSPTKTVAKRRREIRVRLASVTAAVIIATAGLAAGADDGWTPLMAAAGAMGHRCSTSPNIDDAVVVTEQTRLDAIALAWKLGTDLEAMDQVQVCGSGSGIM